MNTDLLRNWKIYEFGEYPWLFLEGDWGSSECAQKLKALDVTCRVINKKRNNNDDVMTKLFQYRYATRQQFLRLYDCKYRESLARLKKSKILIICLENPFREMYSKNSRFEKSNVSEEMGKNKNLGFYLINYAKNTVKLTNFSVRVLKEDVW